MINFVQRLLINGESLTVKSSEVKLTLNRPGRGRFMVYSETNISIGSKVEFESGYQGSMISSWLLGFVESAIEVETNIYRLFCRELSAVYLQNVSVSVRSATIPKITKALSLQTGLAFSIPDKPYALAKVPTFVGLNRGVDTIKSIGSVFGIDDFIWFVQSDHSIFLGDYKDSVFSGFELPIDKGVFISLNNLGGELPSTPGVVPGVSINGKRVHEISIVDEKMEASWFNNY